MSAEYAGYALDVVDDLLEADSIRDLTTKRCEFCGASGLHWTPTDRGWRLAQNGEIHSCKAYQTAKAAQREMREGGGT